MIPCRTLVKRETANRCTPRRLKERKEILAIYQDCRCLACDIRLPINLFEMAHDISRKHGGTASMQNVFCLLCTGCNRKQGTRSLLEAFPEKYAEIERMRCLFMDQLLNPDASCRGWLGACQLSLTRSRLKSESCWLSRS